MSHDKVKAAARRRMNATGEPYAAARRQDISEHHARCSTSAVSPDDVRAAAEVHGELGPEYSDAVVASFIDKVDRAVAARVEARLADQVQSAPAKRASKVQRPLARRVARDVLAASAGALVAVGAVVGLHGINSPNAGPPVSRAAGGACPGRAAKPVSCSVLVHADGQVTYVTYVAKGVPPGLRPGRRWLISVARLSG
jgi:hypothetical protein